MPRLRDLLQRFGPAGAPGRASAAGVPADRREAVAEELEPVFAELAGVLLECDELRRTSVAAAGRGQADSAHRARTLVAQALIQAKAERAGAAATVRQRATAAASESLVRAEADAARIRQRGLQQRPELLARVVARVRINLETLADAGHRGDGPG